MASGARGRAVMALVVTSLAIVVVAASGLAALYIRRPGPDGLARRPDPGPVRLAEPTVDGNPLIIADVIGASGSGQEVTVVISVDPPADAGALQIGFDPTFRTQRWMEPVDEVRLAVTSKGYQVIHGRFRLVDGTVTEPSLVGVSIDTTVDAATTSAEGLHRPSWIRPLSPTELVVRVEAGRIRQGSLVAYDLDDPPNGDRVSRGLIGPRMVHRDGEPYAFPVSERTDVVRTIDQLIGQPLDAAAAAEGSWLVRSEDASGVSAAESPVSVKVVSRPSGGGLDENGEPLSAVVHDFVIGLSAPLVSGTTYIVEPPAGLIEPAALEFDQTETLSPAVRVNQVGYGVGDGAKFAYLAGWFDDLGAATADAADTFQLLASQGEVVFEGPIARRPNGQDFGRGDLTGTAVGEMEFSAFDAPGRYRVCVAGLGCSYDFAIEENPWRLLTSTVARAMYHQRSGIELGPPFTSFVRPRPFHPDDGLEVMATRSTMSAAAIDPETRFLALASAATEESIPDAWGGHFDAGDWDRRVQHLWYARNAAQLLMAFPETFEDDLNIPESGDAVPDILDEGLWSLDLYRRMQREDGAIRGGVESSEHPPVHSTSWIDDLAVYAFEPDPWSSYVYAGVAAEVSAALRPYDQVRADDYRASAEAAINWADAQARQESDLLLVESQRHVAMAAMLLATGERRWHDAFVETAEYLTVGFGDDGMLCHAHTRCDAGWLYLQADQSVTDPEIRQVLRERFVSSAESIAATAELTAYRWTAEDPNVPLVWGLGAGGAPRTSGLLRAYLLSGEERFRNAALAAAGFSLGANPMNRVMVTGFGQEPVRHPVIIDVQNGGLPLWAGTPVYGHHQLNAVGDDQWVVEFALGPAGASPLPDAVPYLWQWFDVPTVAFFNEFTVHQGHAEALFSFGVLAATAQGLSRGESHWEGPSPRMP